MIFFKCECEGCMNRATNILTLYNPKTQKSKRIRVCEDCAWEIESEIWLKRLKQRAI